ncbi:MAG: hypothetical protein DLM58_15930 [Pseudonocardiales bacterium]|nr:MAG: hypothetical protein DLM58_15930 [Pseudonocardiales bacterium]
MTSGLTRTTDLDADEAVRAVATCLDGVACDRRITRCGEPAVTTTSKIDGQSVNLAAGWECSG